MKKCLLIFVMFLVCAHNASADIVTPGEPYNPQRPIFTQVVITNIDSYPDIALLSYSNSGNQVKLVQQGIKLCYGFNNLLVRKSVLEAQGGLGEVDLNALKAKHTSAVVIEPKEEWVPGTGAPVITTHSYRITGVTTDTLSLHYEGLEGNGGYNY
jgi:hypothetical protein